MPAVASNQPCTICLKSESVMHSHHTVPQSRGGVNSLQIILCSSCHNILHANALYVVSKMRNPKRPAKSFWSTPDEEQRAARWLEILVQSLVTPVDEPESVECLITAKTDRATFERFKLLAKDLGCSQEKALEYCIKFTLTKKGFNNVAQTSSELWFLPVSKS